ncbi:cytochrome c oxidase subunit 2 [Celeribacter indicus]|uniref:Cytochrome c, monoheme n=1 Tax=Celeribacter indicus TaxID=1208324 RepID=A0A0B5E030_9RHOB|nr:cytochrome c, monoheme [Celeribacter indicus]SDW44862.1 cytochrome c oxidase subunit 2 [Celeribacter indicus]
MVLSGCAGRQSVLDPAGTDAAALSVLFTGLLIGAVVLWLAMNGMFYYFIRRRLGTLPERYGRLVIFYGGVVTPTLLIGATLVWGLSLLPDQRLPGEGLRVRVTGEQWWWRVEYWPDGAAEPVVSANEIRLPAGRRTEFVLDSDQVIHSFWIPALGGKMDMFPGRETRMSLHPETPGVYRGQCAEFCGTSHAWMAFETVVMPEEEFEDWLAAEAEDARPPASAAAERGAALFRREGCGACHAVRGTDAIGQVGPDLTHLGARHSIGAARIGTSTEEIAAWIRDAGAFKPDVRMPAYPDLTDAESRDIALYLKDLK